MAKTSADFVKFVAIGGFAATLNLLSRIVFSAFTIYEIAIVLAYGIGMMTAFELNRAFVFEKTGEGRLPQLAKFSAVNVVALLQIFVISVGLARFVFPALEFTLWPETVAHGIGLGSVTLTSYWLHRVFTFASKTSASS
ncbi:MAG: GtrA family protein [Pseudomonadota bacterium]